MWLWFGRKAKVRRVKGGRQEKRKCPECDATAMFVEVEVKKTYTAYVVVDLFDTESTKFACESCGEFMDLEDTGEPELSAREQARKANADAKAEAKRKKELQRAADKARAQAQQREDDLDDELAAMKARLGLD